MSAAGFEPGSFRSKADSLTSRPSWLLAMNSARFSPRMEYGRAWSALEHRNHCNSLSYLVDRQKQLCSLSWNILRSITEGARLGIKECQNQFWNDRWNCSTFPDAPNVFGTHLRIHSREKAYVYSVSAAGVAYSVTRACSSGALAECGCDDRIHSRPTRDRFEWGGCSEDLRFGEFFSKEFVDAREDPSSAEGLMNLHNNEAGRRALRGQMETLCKCHGVSGSCSIRICWRKLRTFRHTGDYLRQKFDGAVHVRMVTRRKKKKLRPINPRIKKPSKRDLVFLDESPNYCIADKLMGVLGTSGRLCNVTSPGMEGCRLLCCGRGYHTIQEAVTQQCNCRFKWCCDVECEQCTAVKDMQYCN
ncbi:Wnt [Trinorchestia longiramus]|nr:Wnt [Trinorchestia longiramus]